MTKRQIALKALCEEMGWDYEDCGHKIDVGLSIKKIEQILDRLQK